MKFFVSACMMIMMLKEFQGKILCGGGNFSVCLDIGDFSKEIS